MNTNLSANQLFIIGGGGHATSCVEIIESQGNFEIIGFLDNDVNAPLATIGYSYLGNDSQAEKLIELGYSVAIGLGQIKNVDLRQNSFDMLDNANANMPVIKASTSYVSPSAILGKATMVFHKSVINIAAHIGENCIVNTGAVIEHGCVIGRHTHIAPRAIVLGNAKIGERCFVGAGTIIFQGVNIPDNSIIPAGTIIKQTL